MRKSRNPEEEARFWLWPLFGCRSSFGTIVWIPLADLHVGGSRSCEAAISCPPLPCVSIPGSYSTLHLVDGLLTGPQGWKSCSRSVRNMDYGQRPWVTVAKDGWLALPKPVSILLGIFLSAWTGLALDHLADERPKLRRIK